MATNERPIDVPGQTWFAINKTGETEAEILIYDEIGAYGVTAQGFVNELAKVEAKTLNVRLNTPGGEVFDGTAIYNALKAHPAKVIVHIDGVAASAGSFVAMSGDEIRMADNAYIMIHNARGGVMGDAEDMRAYASSLEKMNANIAAMYEKKAGDTQDWKGLMDAETWFNAEEAKAAGLVDEVFESKKRLTKTAAKLDVRMYNKIPDPVRDAWGIPKSKAPEPSLRSEVLPVLPQQETQTMSTEAPVAPAQSPAAPSPSTAQEPSKPVKSTMESLRETEIQGYRDQGYREGEQAGRNAEQARMKAITEACPGKPQMALSAFLSGQTPEAVRLAFDEANRTDAEWQQRFEQERINNARQVALAAAGGHSGVGVVLSNVDEDTDGAPLSEDDAKATATAEWDNKPKVRKGFASKENYVAYRKHELMGRVQTAR